MRRLFIPLIALGLVLAGQGAAAEPRQAAAPSRPNFLVIVADDLGFSDLGAFGGEIDTPNLDALAARALKLANFHTAPTCSPTRAMLLTGADNHEAGLGSMAELVARNQRGRPGYQTYLAPDTATLPEMLGAAGYRTLFSGKWHLGVKPEQDPSRRGFQHSFVLLQGYHNHFGKDLSRDPGRGAAYRENGQIVTSLPADFYSSDYFATKLIEQLRQSRSGTAGKAPFFAYLAFTAPHLPLQAPPEAIAKYRGKYDAGYEVLRERRLRRQAELGLISPAVVAHPMEMSRAWAALTPEQRALSARRMEVFAAMVDRLDMNVGRVLAALRETGELDNTIILFLSDNGAEGHDLEAVDINRDAPTAKGLIATADNRLESLGGPASFAGTGSGWAEAQTAPSWRYKAYQTEGGTHSVAMLAGPDIPTGTGRAFTSVMDVTPTFLDLAGARRPGRSFEGRSVRAIRGETWLPWLAGKSKRVYSPRQYVPAELFGGKAVRQGDWKLLDPGDGRWRLFNLARDPGETADLIAKEPARARAMQRAWESYAASIGIILPDPPASIVNQPLQRKRD